MDLLLVAHGSRLPEARTQAFALADRVDWDGTVQVGFLELAEPNVMDVEPSSDDVVVQPLLLLPGGHARFDVRSVADRLDGQGRTVRVGKPLGTHVQLLDQAVANVRAVGEVDALLVVASGTASDEALRTLDTAAALVASGAGLEVVSAAPTSLDGSAPAAAYRELRAQGHRRVALLPWMLFPGRLEAAATEAVQRAAADDGGAVAIVDRFGPSEQVARAVEARARAARPFRAP